MNNPTTTKKYIIQESGADFRKIAKIMTKAGYKMNHATARNILLGGMEKLFKGVSKELKIDLNNENMELILKDQEVHDALVDVLYTVQERKEQ